MAAAAAMPACWRVGRPMRVHGSVEGVRVDGKVELGLEQRRWMVGRTDELDTAATASAGSGTVWCLSNAREGEVHGASGEPNGVHAGQVARPAGPRRLGRGAWPRRRRA
jgi:hypothetical protein